MKKRTTKNTKGHKTTRTPSCDLVMFWVFRGSGLSFVSDRLSAYRTLVRAAVQLLVIICLSTVAATAQGLARGARVDRLVLVPSDELPANARSISGNVIYIYDGDTFSVATEDHKVYT